ncbi:progestin and adipoQ receptor family member 3-like [Biomphalaria glabrata]|uniref:Progestin and adipoQ receptor family member 3-like n=1 Tax=Biomphalaria glabrata TaxID=6526 RepID=A0A2C9JGV9_BIOGL|nr:progestin and adipoQ receptor family member 3-like [Biomphalaria glabrata]XP_055875512.1 progestin and adipoQ receptor family member 3-like [Biomphalaria glabrata]XP_055875513.1 progestin and adipoQ receptor family member 3-like [Biomphalaria glabrata]XP_055875514.1 progestin and adipoQ receptor family member 3-like [Biomphalaria glabrata]XP_055875515.1 progestin and adipoQ receptor family member 3-like [Biomphalaria glabrata]KAI8766306.1 progestin and adipoQ receptor family member 3-like [
MALPFGSYDSVKNRQNRSLLASTQFEDDSYHIMDIEIDKKGLETCQTGLCNLDGQELVLLKYHEVPEFLRGNPYVVHGYRSLLPFNMCMKSLLFWTNETMNIWTHFMGFFVFLLLVLYDNIIALPSMNGSLSDHIILTIGLSCFMFCMLCSTGFHIFCCHSERASRRWLAFDMTGVTFGIIGCYLPAVHYAFYCLSIWRDLYMISITVLSACILIFNLHPHFFSHKWFYTRMALYVGLTAYGIIPTVHWIYLNGGISSHIVQMFIPKVTMMYMLGSLAFSFYITKFPERIFPGKFDFIGSSHQLWHILIVIAFCYWHKAGKEILMYRIAHECPA